MLKKKCNLKASAFSLWLLRWKAQRHGLLFSRHSMTFETTKSKPSSGVAKWIEGQPVNQRVAGSIPSQGTCLGCGPGPQ